MRGFVSISSLVNVARTPVAGWGRLPTARDPNTRPACLPVGGRRPARRGRLSATRRPPLSQRFTTISRRRQLVGQAEFFCLLVGLYGVAVTRRQAVASPPGWVATRGESSATSRATRSSFDPAHVAPARPLSRRRACGCRHVFK